ncbi:hypothetical protein CGRA01v4_14074 [Colletotrichum graminicola]|nr:hypothetical protein CGRA01v4_14074 [Colletotrichum graminicola]
MLTVCRMLQSKHGLPPAFLHHHHHHHATTPPTHTHVRTHTHTPGGNTTAPTNRVESRTRGPVDYLSGLGTCFSRASAGTPAVS